MSSAVRVCATAIVATAVRLTEKRGRAGHAEHEVQPRTPRVTATAGGRLEAEVSIRDGLTPVWRRTPATGRRTSPGEGKRVVANDGQR